jgi:hypothetical protein
VARAAIEPAAQAIARFFFENSLRTKLMIMAFKRRIFLCYPWGMMKNSLRLLNTAKPTAPCSLKAAGELAVNPAWSVSHE